MDEETLQKLLPELRALRLWHWEEVLHHADLERFYSASSNYIYASYEQRCSDFHTKQVHLLNSFFDPNDTAEKDRILSNTSLNKG